MRFLNPRVFWLRAKIKNDPYYRFQSLEEVAIAAELNIQIEVNWATVDDWLRLPGISIHQARTLTELTAAGVQFFGLEDLAAALNVPLKRVEPLAPILSFSFRDPESALTPQQFNPNTATAEELATIPFLDSQLAQQIVENRQTYGKYSHLADLQQRLGFHQQLTAQLMHYLRF